MRRAAATSPPPLTLAGSGPYSLSRIGNESSVAYGGMFIGSASLSRQSLDDGAHKHKGFAVGLSFAVDFSGSYSVGATLSGVPVLGGLSAVVDSGGNYRVGATISGIPLIEGLSAGFTGGSSLRF